MKREQFESIFAEVAKDRECKMIAVFNAENMPKIAITVLPRGYFEAPIMPYELHNHVELKNFRETIEGLKEDEIFVLGRRPECDYRPGFDEVKKYEAEGKLNAEYFYMRNYVTISRLHCFVKKLKDGKFALYDCSLAGTCIVL